MRILVVEDQPKMSGLLKKGLNESGFEADVAETASQARELIGQNVYDLMILDVMLPDQNGMQLARSIREQKYSGPILMLTALSTTKDKVMGLDAGADDYLTKPYSFDELLARVRALLRRNSAQPATQNTLQYADLELDLLNREAKRAGQLIPLTTKEFSLLEYFMKNVEKPLSRKSIAEDVWDIHFDSESNVIDVYVNMLRKKIDSPFSTKLIQTVVGVGYALKKLNP